VACFIGGERMSWRFGIPDFIGNYTYFRDLGNTDRNIPAAAARK